LNCPICCCYVPDPHWFVPSVVQSHPVQISERSFIRSTVTATCRCNVLEYVPCSMQEIGLSMSARRRVLVIFPGQHKVKFGQLIQN
jgi:hypothetical protein